MPYCRACNQDWSGVHQCPPDPKDARIRGLERENAALKQARTRYEKDAATKRELRERAEKARVCDIPGCPAMHEHHLVWCDHVVQRDLKGLTAERDAALARVRELEQWKQMMEDASVQDYEKLNIRCIEAEARVKELEAKCEDQGEEYDNLYAERDTYLTQVQDLTYLLAEVNKHVMPGETDSVDSLRMLVAERDAALAHARQLQSDLGDSIEYQGRLREALECIAESYDGTTGELTANAVIARAALAGKERPSDE